MEISDNMRRDLIEVLKAAEYAFRSVDSKYFMDKAADLKWRLENQKCQ